MRLPDWTIRFNDFMQNMRVLAAKDKIKFSWNTEEPDTLDCLRFGMMDAVALTGVDMVTQKFGPQHYDSPRAAIKALQAQGCSSLEELMHKLYVPLPSRTYAMQGDLILLPAVATLEGGENGGPFQYAVGIADPPFFWVIQPDVGLSRGSMKSAVKAFRVE
jgi:hypothetical protein